MLVIKRRLGESIIINGKVTVTILSTQGDAIRVGIDAPDETRVDRAEVFHRQCPGDPGCVNQPPLRSHGKKTFQLMYYTDEDE